jgi:hypothetical protein
MALLIKTLIVAKKIYSYLGFYGELSVGLTVLNTKNLLWGGYQQHRSEIYECEESRIHIYRTIRYDHLSQLDSIIQSFFEELCTWFNLFLEKQTIIDIVNKIIKATF